MPMLEVPRRTAADYRAFLSEVTPHQGSSRELPGMESNHRR